MNPSDAQGPDVLLSHTVVRDHHEPTYLLQYFATAVQLGAGACWLFP